LTNQKKRTALKRQQYLTVAIVVAALVGCAGEAAPAGGGEVPTGTPIPAPTAVEDETVVEEANASAVADEPIVTDAPQEPEAPTASPFDPVRDVILPWASNGDLAGATLYQLMSIPVPGGESLVFHFEDEKGAAQLGCSGHALSLLTEDGSAYELGGLAVNCGLSAVDDPLTFFLSQGIDPDGGESTVVYGEIYDAGVVAIRVPYQGGEVNATIIGGGFQAFLPPDASGIVVRAYDSAGSLVFEGEPKS
jgi:hypothetical protein